MPTLRQQKKQYPANSTSINHKLDQKECPFGKFVSLQHVHGYSSRTSLRYVQIGCTQCKAGRYGASVHLKSPLCSGGCEAGKYSTEGWSICKICPVGKTSVPGQRKCKTVARHETVESQPNLTNRKARTSTQMSAMLAMLASSKDTYTKLSLAAASLGVGRQALHAGVPTSFFSCFFSSCLTW
jgi:hypothetical protein